MTLQDLLLALHILLVVLLLGPLISYGLVLPGLIRKGPEMAKSLAVIEKIQTPLERATGSILIVGIILVINSPGDEYKFSQGWVSASLALFIVAAGIGMGVLAPTFRKAVEKLSAGETATAEAARLQVAMLVNLAVFLTILWLMIDKPGLT